MGAPTFGRSGGCLRFRTVACTQDRVGQPCGSARHSCPVWKGLHACPWMHVCIQALRCMRMYVCAGRHKCIPVLLCAHTRACLHCQQQGVCLCTTEEETRQQLKPQEPPSCFLLLPRREWVGVPPPGDNVLGQGRGRQGWGSSPCPGAGSAPSPRCICSLCSQWGNWGRGQPQSPT